MIIHPSREGMPDFTEAVQGFNRAPKAGDEGHVDDHARLSQVLFDVPQHMEVGTVAMDQEQWFILPPRETDTEKARQVSFAEVREFTERAGVHVVPAMGEHEDADGVTDHTDEATVAAIQPLAVYAAGLIGLAQVVQDVIGEVAALKAAQA